MKAKRLQWYMDSGCSHHMTGDASKFINIKPKDGGKVVFGDNNKGKIVGVGKVGKNVSNSIEDVMLVKGLEHNLLSVSQLCDKGNKVTFDSKTCLVQRLDTNEVVLVGHRIDNIYMIDLDNIPSNDAKCLAGKQDDSWLWHRRMAHLNMDYLNKLVSKDLVISLPKLKFEKDMICDACQKGKQVKASFKSKNIVSTTRPLQLLHMDLFGPSRTMRFGGNYYALVIVDDYSRYTWTSFIAHKHEAFRAFKKLAKVIQNERNLNIASIRSDHGGEFKNEAFENFCEENRMLCLK